MTDQKVLTFGSFTEDEIKNLQSQPTKIDVGITFGSIDSATLKSVGIFNTQLTGFDHSKTFQPSELARKENVSVTRRDTGETIKSVGKALEKSDSSSGLLPDYNRSTVLKPSHEELHRTVKSGSASENVSELATSIVDVTLIDPLKNSNLVNGRHNSLKALNGPAVVFRSLLPRGLVNLGNLCFLNATLQALLSCSPFVHLVQELKSRHIPQAGYPTLHAFVQFISDFGIPIDSSMKRKETIVLETGQPFRPLMFEAVLKNFTPDVPNSLTGRPRQEDAQEFLSFLMHQMHDELLKLEGQVPNGIGNSSLVSSTDDEEEGDDWETVGPRNKTAITRTQSFVPSKLSGIFGGQLKSVVEAKGNKASATVQPFLLLHLNICPEPICSIEDALQMFSAPEALEGYRTSAAGKAEVVSASKSVKIMEPSDIMVLHLMRFSYGSEGSTKLHKPVHFPLELAFGRELLVSPSFEGRRYELVATITHHGRDPSKGHYTADARHSSGKWLRYDDVSVTVIPTSKVLHDQAYILFYKQL